jgi:plasmid stabilization system protein ParE
MKIKLLSSALDDLYDGRLFYEKQGEELGEYFYDSLFSDIDSLTLYGGMHPKFFGYHRMLSKRFPYAIYYKIEEGSLAVTSPMEIRTKNRFPHPSILYDV